MLNTPPRPIVPTPIPSVPAINVAVNGTPVVNPQSAITATVDPDILGLMEAVSQQQLLAYVQTLDGYVTRHSLSDTQREDYGIGAARRWIFAEFERVGAGRLQVELDDFPATIAGITTNQQNIIATLPGSDPNSGLIVMSAHYDSRNLDINDGFSRAPGGDDNASGVAALIEVARLMSSREWQKTVVFIAFAAEEQGTYGSRHYVQEALLDGRFINADINNDIVGGRPGIPQSVRLYTPMNGNTGELARYINYIGGLYLPTFPVQIFDALDREGRYSDHREFIIAGVPAVRLVESEEDTTAQHTSFDTWDKVDYSYLQKIAQLNLAILTNLAGSPARPSVPAVATMANGGDYILTWAVDPAAAGYVISFRPIDSPTFPAPFKLVNAKDAGNIVLTGFDPAVTYAVSMAALSSNGRISQFSTEVIVGP